MQLKETNLMGVNIPKELKRLSEKYDKQEIMTEDELKIYNLAKDNIISLLKVFLDSFTDGETIIFYNPSADIIQEFDMDEIYDMMNNIK